MLFALLLLRTRAEVVWKGCRERERGREEANNQRKTLLYTVVRSFGPSQEVDGNSFEFTQRIREIVLGILKIYISNLLSLSRLLLLP